LRLNHFFLGEVLCLKLSIAEYVHHSIQTKYHPILAAFCQGACEEYRALMSRHFQDTPVADPISNDLFSLYQMVTAELQHGLYYISTSDSMARLVQQVIFTRNM
jgi:hypothetical protein